MTSIFLTCLATTRDHPFARRDYERLVHYGATDQVKSHFCCDNPETADLIGFIGSSTPNYTDVRQSDLYTRYKDKSVIFNSTDRCIPFLPGVYACLEAGTAALNSAALSGFYLRVTENDGLDIDAGIEESRYLFSFVGNSRTHPVRRRICSIRDDRGLICDTSKNGGDAEPGRTLFRMKESDRYIASLADSKFVLCPRGFGVASWRLFETMRAGRVPVIVSDDWVPTVGPEWGAFSIRVPEKDWWRIPQILAETESAAMEMGRTARAEWERWFRKEVVFNTVMDLFVLAHSRRNEGQWGRRALLYTHYLKPFFLRHWVLGPLKRNFVKGIGRSN